MGGISRLRRGISFGEMAVGLLFVAFALRALMMPAQNDTFWHLRAGQDIWLLGEVPRIDRYSHTFAGGPWPDHEWFAQALMFLAYRVGGMPGLEIGAALLVLAAVVVTWRLMVGSVPTRALVMTVGLTLASCVWVLRPHVLSQLLLALLLWLLVRERYRLIPLLFVVWANAHGGVVLGGLALAAAWAAAVLRWWRGRQPVDRARVRTLSVVVGLSGLACAATPLGFGIYRFVIESTARSVAVRITEWFPALPDDLFGVLFWGSTVGFVALVIRRCVRPRGLAAWEVWVTTATALAILPLAVRSIRNTAPFIICAMPAVTGLLGADFRLRPWLERIYRGKPRPASPDKPLLNLAILAVAAAGAALVAGVVMATNHKSLNWRPISDQALTALRTCDGPLYNHYDEGGYLIWFTPEKPVFIDGRQDPYPMAFMLDAMAVERKQAPYRPLFERWGIRCVFLAKGSPTVEALTSDGWVTRHRDDKWVVFSAPAR
jgi:hypothetical protein